MANSSSSYDDLPPLPLYHLTPLPPLVSHIPDKFLTCLLPIGAYWVASMFFHWIDTKDYFPQYRLHTPAEVLKRNRVSQSQVVRDVLVQQVLQTIMATLLGMTEPEDFTGKQEYDVAVWARRVRLAQRALPWLLSLVGVDAGGLARSMAGSYSMLAGAISGGRYPSLTDLVSVGTGSQGQVPRFATWELMTAKALYHFITPAIQFGVAMFVVDTWQYFLHRAMHMNKWLYTTFHSRHHRLYVPYAFGALYNHPFEGFLLDILGAAVAFKVTGMSTRQGMWFFTCSTIKTVDDHCGYALPWDPLQHLTSNNAGYHDVHHQSWGIKTNFSQPFSTFWDRTLGTVWTGGDVSARYERSRIAAQRKVDQEGSKTITNSNVADSKNLDPAPYQDEIKNAIELRTIEKRDLLPQIPTGKAEQQAAGSRQQVLDDKQGGGFEVLAEEAQEEEEARSMLRRSTRKKATSISQTDSFKGLRDRVAGMHGRSGGIIGMESGR